MSTKYHYGTLAVSGGLGVLAGFLIRKSQEKRDVDAEARAKGFIKPTECPPPCPPFDQIIEEGQCVRCGGQWIPPTGPYGKGECIPRQDSGTGSGPGGTVLPPPLQPGTGTGTGGPSNTLTYDRPGQGVNPGTPTKLQLPGIG